MHFSLASTALLLLLAAIAPAMAATYTITVTDQGFQPASLCIAARDSVQWSFSTAGHNVEETTEPGSCVSRGTWKSIVMSQGWRWNRQFKEESTISYMSSMNQDCTNGMKGVIHVGSCPSTPIPSTSTTTAPTTAGKPPLSNAGASIFQVAPAPLLALMILSASLLC